VQRLGFWRRGAVIVVKPLLIMMTKRDWSGMEHIPRDGGVIFAPNHMSEFDPFVVAHFVLDSGRWPQYLAKSTLFKVPVLGPLLRAVRQIPVDRGTIDASRALAAAKVALDRGEDVIVYPEGTTPKKGELWPGRGKTGIARLYLATGAPVVPVATWGAQQIFDPRVRKFRPRPRTPVTVIAGPAIDLSKWDGAEPTAANLYAITDEIMAVLRVMVGEIRGETPPEAPSSAGRRGPGGTDDAETDEATAGEPAAGEVAADSATDVS
jgi:1-acyl-sn-glycerol-3-phosphate acyltransferase